MDGIAQETPEGATVVQEDRKMYFQFDTVFFEQVRSNSGMSYRVVSFFTPSELRGLEKISDRRGVSLSAVIHSLVTRSLEESDGPA
jgi:hypothetical protein